MLEIKIASIKGYDIFYATRDRRFELRNQDGEVVGQGKTQDEVEKQAELLSKKQFSPIAAFKQYDVVLEPGRITSLNIDEQTVWFVPEKKTGPSWERTRQKVSLRHSTSMFEATEKNQEIAKVVESKVAEIHRIEKDIESLISTMEKVVNLAYFGLVS